MLTKYKKVLCLPMLCKELKIDLLYNTMEIFDWKAIAACGSFSHGSTLCGSTPSLESGTDPPPEKATEFLML